MTTLRRVAVTRGGAGFPHAEQGLESGDLPFIKVSDFNHQGNERTITRCSNWVSRATAARLGASIVPGGALLLPKVGAALLGNARRLTSRPSVFDNNVLAVVPSEIDSRYLHYWLSTIDAAAFSKPGPVPSMGDDALLDLVVPVDGAEEQRAVAGYLDAETTRIDALIAKKQQLIHLIEERWATTLADAFGDPSGVRLKYILAAPMAYGVLVPDHVQDGPMMLRISDFRHGDPDPESVARISEMLHRQYRRTIVREGDLVVSVVGTLGRAAIVPPPLIGANLNRALARVQLQPDAPVDLVRLWCESTLFTDQARLATSSDSAQPTLNLGDLKNFELGLPMLRSSWPAILGHLRAAEVWKEQGRGRVTRQINLLAEHRQALITAAVTGQFAIPVAS